MKKVMEKVKALILSLILVVAFTFTLGCPQAPEAPAPPAEAPAPPAEAPAPPAETPAPPAEAPKAP